MHSRALFVLVAGLSTCASVTANEGVAARTLRDQADILALPAGPTAGIGAGVQTGMGQVELGFPAETLRAQGIPAGGVGAFAFTLGNRSSSEATIDVQGMLMSLRVSEADAERVLQEYTFVSDQPDVCLPPVAVLNGFIPRISFSVRSLAAGADVTCRYRIERSNSSLSDLRFEVCGAIQPGAYLSPFCPQNRFLRGSLPDLRLSVESVPDQADVLRLTVQNFGDVEVAESSATTGCWEFVGGIFGPTAIDLLGDLPEGCPAGDAEEYGCVNFTGQSFDNRAFKFGPLPAGGSASCLVRVVRTNREGEHRIPLFLVDGALPRVEGGVAYDPDPINDDASIVADPLPADARAFTGTWYEPATSGQGLLLEVYPSRGGQPDGLLAAGWFTHNEDGSARAWYTLVGPAPSAATSAELEIYASYNGNFAAAPATTPVRVGTATLTFSRCNSADLVYEFDGGAAGAVPLQRFSGACLPDDAEDELAMHSGIWSEPHLPGQGIAVEVVRLGQRVVLVAGWFTYGPDGATSAASSSQRWYTLNGDYVEGSDATADVAIHETRGGQFDRIPPRTQETIQVGTGRLTFSGCNALTLEYAFDAGEQSGRSGTLHLARVGPPPPGCE